MQRTEILEKLELVAPALADNDMVPILSHFWFDGTRLMAYNDQIAISTPIKTEFTGAVSKVLRDLLKNSKAKDVTFEPKDKELHVKAANSNFKLGLLPARDFSTAFTMPKTGHSQEFVEIRNIPDFLDAIEACMQSVTTDASTPDQLGVTLIPKGKGLHLFSTDSATLSYAEVAIGSSSNLSQRVILAGAFCREMLRMCSNTKKTFSLRVTEDYSLLQLANGDTLFGKLIHSESPVAFEDILRHHFPVSAKNDLVAIPTALEMILHRACVICDAARTRTQITVDSGTGKMHFFSRSPHGEVRDNMKVEGHHPSVKANLEAKLLKAGYGKFDSMLITDKCAIMTRNKDRVIYMISATES